MPEAIVGVAMAGSDDILVLGANMAMSRKETIDAQRGDLALPIIIMMHKKRILPRL